MDQARDAASRLYRRLTQDSTHFEWIFYPPESRFFRENGLLFRDTDALEKLSNQLAKVQPFLADVSTDQSIRGTFNLLGRALKEDKGAELDLSTVFDRIAGALRGYLNGSATPLSWTEIMSGEDSKAEDKRVLMEIMPRIEYSTLAPGEDLMASIRKIGDDLHLADEGVTMRLTGAAVLSIDEVKSASIGAQMASLGSFLGVSLVMLIGLRSLWLVLSVQISLVLGLIFTAAFAALFLGSLNLISVAFSVMYIGIGADYAIYLSLRYRELAARSFSHPSALKRAVRHVGGSLEIGTLTTAIGFFCFIPTSYRGVAELGIISGAGMFISLFVTLAILPAFLVIRRPTRFLGPHAGHRAVARIAAKSPGVSASPFSWGPGLQRHHRRFSRRTAKVREFRQESAESAGPHGRVGPDFPGTAPGQPEVPLVPGRACQRPGRSPCAQGQAGSAAGCGQSADVERLRA